MLKYVLLGTLNYSSMTGYELKSFMDSSTTYFWHARLSQIYTTLKNLERDGLLKSSIEPQEERPDRRVYEITQAGRDALNSWLMEPLTSIEPRKETLLVKLFFAGKLDKDVLLAQLHLQRQLYLKELRSLREQAKASIQQALHRSPALEYDAQMWEATRRCGELYAEMMITWLEEIIAMIEARNPDDAPAKRGAR